MQRGTQSVPDGVTQSVTGVIPTQSMGTITTNCRYNAAPPRSLHAIRDRNDWRQFHSPKNLAMAASVEMSELVEIFQWLTEDQSRQLPADKLAHAGQEIGDIVLYLLLLCSELGLDMNEVVRSKLADSERRFS